MKRLIIVWGGGLIAAVFLLWLVVPEFMNSPPQWKYNEDLEMFVVPEGHTVRFRAEGKGNTLYGKYGIPSIDAGEDAQKNWVGIWGDSFVEGHQVNDDEKMQQQATVLSKTVEDDGLSFCAIGRSGRSVVDYVSLIPRYESILGLKHHFIVISHLDDFRADGIHFLRDPHRINSRKEKFSNTEWRWKLKPYRLDFLLNPLVRTVKDIRANGLQFRMGKVRWAESSQLAGGATDAEFSEDASYLLDALGGVSTVPVSIVYIPHVPSLKKGKILFSDEKQVESEMLRKLCAEKKIGFISLRESFCREYRETGRFPFGFSNLKPADGHLNAAGHRLVAESIVNSLKGKQNAIYSD